MDYETPRANKDAGGFAAINEMKMFQALGYKIDFLPENLAYFGSATETLERIGIRCINHPETTSVKEYLQAYANEYDIIFVTRFNVAEPYIDILKNSKNKFYFNNADLHFLREYRQLSNLNQADLVKDIRKRELAIIEAADVAFCYTEIERQVIESHILQKNKVKIMPWVTKVKVNKPIAKPDGKFGFLGSFHHKPNLEAVDYIKKVLAKKCSHQEFIVGGYGWKKEKIDNFENIGAVDDLKNFFSECRALIVPLTSGAGIKGKVFESLSYGVPIISTPIGAEGIPIEQSKIGFVTELDFFHKKINSFVELQLDKPKEFENMMANALHFVERYYSLKAGVNSLDLQLKFEK